ncbi:MAG TPA: hypothetical protein VF669_21590 [Tepidisphaeraceae bacterium]|jgi:hypothetical protein
MSRPPAFWSLLRYPICIALVAGCATWLSVSLVHLQNMDTDAKARQMGDRRHKPLTRHGGEIDPPEVMNGYGGGYDTLVATPTNDGILLENQSSPGLNITDWERRRKEAQIERNQDRTLTYIAIGISVAGLLATAFFFVKWDNLYPDRP